MDFALKTHLERRFIIQDVNKGEKEAQLHGLNSPGHSQVCVLFKLAKLLEETGSLQVHRNTGHVRVQTGESIILKYLWRKT